MKHDQQRLGRRTVLGGAATVGALAATAVVLKHQPQADQPVVAKRPQDSSVDGYQLSDHVKHYYKTTRI